MHVYTQMCTHVFCRPGRSRQEAEGKQQLEISWGLGTPRSDSHQGPRKERLGQDGKERCANAEQCQHKTGLSERLHLRRDWWRRNRAWSSEGGTGREGQEARVRYQLKLRKLVPGHLKIPRRLEQREVSHSSWWNEKELLVYSVRGECGALTTDYKTISRFH